ncbi:MAG: radical SAM protein, partial [Chloroflexi bacterium]|nr:radical SAM protein [Chloroflexota bacterium]
TLERWQQQLAAMQAQLTGQPSPQAGPYYILELTPRCTQDCRYCYNVWKLRPEFVTGELDTAQWCALIAKLQDETGCRLVTFSGGEPLLRPDWRDILAFCHQRGLSSILITNGGLLDAEALRFCLDHGVTMFELTLLGSDAATHNRLTRTPGSWGRALAAMTLLYQAQATWCGVFVATRENIAQVRQTLEMVIALGATTVMFNRFNPGGEGARHLDLLPTVEQVQEALAVVDELAAAYGLSAAASIPIMPCLIDTSPYRHIGFGYCAAGRENAYYTVSPDGRVRPCNHTATILGDLRTQTLSEMLAGPTLAEFTAAAPDVCRPCPGLPTCRAGCRAAAEVCFDSLAAPEPWLRANLDRLPPQPA